MPELPEVETQARALRKNLLSRPIKKVWVGWAKSIAKPSAKLFKKQILGRRFKAVRRRGKFVLLDLTGGLTLVAHFRMTGHFRLASLEDSQSVARWYLLPEDRFTRVAFGLNNHEVLHFSDIRKFGRLWLIRTSEVEKMPEIFKLGPEPLSTDFKAQDFISCLRHFKGMIKPVLLNQACVAGVGNIYVDESLFDAELHPQTSIAKISDAQLKRLYKMVKLNLAAGIKHQGSSVGDFINLRGREGGHASYLRVYGRAGQACKKTRSGKKCSGKVRRIVVAQRGTHICPACQKIKS